MLPCEAVELSFSCLRRLKTWSKEGRRVCGKGTTFTVLWTNQTLSLCLLCFATLAAMTAVCEIFNLLHFRSTAQRGGHGHGPSGPMVNTLVVVAMAFLQCVRIARNADRCNSQTNSSLCLSVRPSRSGVLFRRMKRRSTMRCSASGRTIILVSGELMLIRIFNGITPSHGVKVRYSPVASENLTNN